MPRAELDGFDRHYLDHGLTTTWDGSVTMLAGTGVVVGPRQLDDLHRGARGVRAEWEADHGLEG